MIVVVLQFIFGFVVSISYFLCFFWVFMVGSSEVRIACPSIYFLFVRLGGSLGVFLHVESFVFEGNSLDVVLTELCPLLHQSLDWFEGLIRERRIMSEVRPS